MLYAHRTINTLSWSTSLNSLLILRDVHCNARPRDEPVPTKLAGTEHAVCLCGRDHPRGHGYYTVDVYCGEVWNVDTSITSRC